MHVKYVEITAIVIYCHVVATSFQCAVFSPFSVTVLLCFECVPLCVEILVRTDYVEIS